MASGVVLAAALGVVTLASVTYQRNLSVPDAGNVAFFAMASYVGLAGANSLTPPLRVKFQLKALGGCRLTPEGASGVVWRRTSGSSYRR